MFTAASTQHSHQSRSHRLEPGSSKLCDQSAQHLALQLPSLASFITCLTNVEQQRRLLDLFGPRRQSLRQTSSRESTCTLRSTTGGNNSTSANICKMMILQIDEACSLTTSATAGICKIVRSVRPRRADVAERYLQKGMQFPQLHCLRFSLRARLKEAPICAAFIAAGCTGSPGNGR